MSVRTDSETRAANFSSNAAAAARDYQRAHLADIHAQVSRGEPFAFVNADAPLEILQAMGIPYVVNQWWSALCAAKQMGARYGGLLENYGFGREVCHYCSMSLASALDPEPATGPWGGLPTPTLLITGRSCDAQHKVFELFAARKNIPCFTIEDTVIAAPHPRWWERVEDDWETLFGHRAIDLMTEEYRALIRFLEMTTGRVFSMRRFEDLMARVNEQEGYYRKTRDMIVGAPQTPMAIVDQLPSIQIPQWHRGSPWALSRARALHDEVQRRVDSGFCVNPNEKTRLMWLGTGLWYNMGLYQDFEQSHGATFVWAMYLGIAADGYVRNGGDPLRALASRLIGILKFLSAPPWDSEWFAHEAVKARINGAILPTAPSCFEGVPTHYFVRRALERVGIPVLDLALHSIDPKRADGDMRAAIAGFLEQRVRPVGS